MPTPTLTLDPHMHWTEVIPTIAGFVEEHCPDFNEDETLEAIEDLYSEFLYLKEEAGIADTE